MYKLLILLILFWVSGSISEISCQSQGFIYGKVILKSGQSYQGQLRLGNQEAMWNDIFDASKSERPYQNLLSTDETQKLQAESGSFKFGFMELWEDRNPDQSFMFRCSFGDMAKLEAKGTDRVILTLKNGHQLVLRSEEGDLVKQIRIADKTTGEQQFKFSSISSIVFMQSPDDFKSHFGNPVYGRVLTSNGSFQGFITWDQEECLSNDIISGKLKGQLLNVPFKDIKEIKADQDGSLITFKSGRELFLNDHDDVDAGNHGITIRSLPFGNLNIGWENFISAEFFTAPDSFPSYDTFEPPSLLVATVRTTTGAKYVSQIVFDLDEIYDIEFLNGANGGFSYYIPFSMVTIIEPQNDKFSAVTVKSGEQFLLGDSGDVDIKNNGLILKGAENKSRFLKWNQVKSIQFE